MRDRVGKQKRPLARRLTAAILLGCTIMLPAASVARDGAAQSGVRYVTAPPKIANQTAYILMDWATGEILEGRDYHVRRSPASTTKVLTALLALEKGDLNDRVKISRRAANTPGSTMYLRAGEVHSLHDLLHGLLMRSGNDAAVAIAEHLAGSVEMFAKLMNRRAREIGARNTHFVNPHGLTAPDHYSTAYDLAVITRYALRNPTFARTVALQRQPITYQYLNRDVVLHNTNRLLYELEGADGVKTGTTAAAGPCLIASATRSDHRLIAVVLHAYNRWRDSAQLLEWGFQNYRLAYLGREGEILYRAPVSKGKQLEVPLALGGDVVALSPRMESGVPKLEVELSGEITAPLKRGQVVGRAVVRIDGQIKSEAPLVTAVDVQRRNLLDAVYQTVIPWIRWVEEFELF